MPTYKNISSDTVVLNSVQFKPLEEKEVGFYAPPTETRLKKTSDEPIWSPVCFSEQKSSGSVKVTENIEEGVNLIRVVAKADSAIVSFNSQDGPKVMITAGSPLAIRPVGRINEVFIHSGEVSVELWKEFNWWG